MHAVYLDVLIHFVKTMIEYIKGELTELTPALATVEAAGVGYGLNISLTTGRSEAIQIDPTRCLVSVLPETTAYTPARKE